MPAIKLRNVVLSAASRTTGPAAAEFTRFSSNGIDIRSNAPEQRFTELDQTDPAGRFRLLGSAGSYSLQRALTANWATNANIFSYDISNKIIEMQAIAARDWRNRLLAGDAAGFQAQLILGGSTASPAGFEFRTGDGVSVNSIRMTIAMTTGLITIPGTLSVNQVRDCQVFQGDGTVDMIVRPNISTDATARRIVLYGLDPATDTFYAVAQIVPNAANPFFSIFAPDVAPTTGLLDVNNIAFRYTPAGALVAYVNNAGVIRSLSLGTPA